MPVYKRRSSAARRKISRIWHSTFFARRGTSGTQGLRGGALPRRFLGYGARGFSLAHAPALLRQPVHPDGHPLPLSRVIHRTAAGATSWEGEVRVPARVVCQLLDSPSLDGLRTNFSAVWFPPGGHACYYSLAPLHGPKPNFHQPDLWLPLHIP